MPAGRSPATWSRASSLARVSFVESYAGDPATLESFDAVVRAFQVFFQDGYRQVPLADPPPGPLTSDAITASLFELLYRESRRSSPPAVVGLLPHGVSLILSPFLGSSPATAFIEEMLAREGL